MFDKLRGGLLGELIIVLTVKVLFILLIWQLFFSGPSREHDARDYILDGVNSISATGIKGGAR